jgi:MFS family permease
VTTGSAGDPPGRRGTLAEGVADLGPPGSTLPMRAGPVGRVGRLARRLATDLTPLRRPDYRRLWAGTTVSVVGSQLTVVAVQIQVFEVSHSSLDVGLIGLVGLVGLLGFGLVGGAIADARDRRRVALLTSSCLTGCSAVLTGLALLGVRSLAALYALVFAISALSAVDQPTRGAIVPRLLPAAELPAGNALSQISSNLGLTGGPLLAGLLFSVVGAFAAYLADTLSFAAALYALWRLPAIPPQGSLRRPGLSAVAEGLRFLRRRPVLYMTFLVDIDAMLFGMPRALFPAIAGGFFHGGAGVVGLLNAAPAVGALAGASLSGAFTRIRRQGLAVLAAVVVWGLAITGFGSTRSLPVGLIALAVAGAADMVSAVFRNTILQVLTPDELRGRLQGVFIVVVTGGPRLGDVESGLVGSLVSPAFSVISGGLACIGGVVGLGLAVPAFARYRADRAGSPPGG